MRLLGGSPSLPLATVDFVGANSIVDQTIGSHIAPLEFHLRLNGDRTVDNAWACEALRIAGMRGRGGVGERWCH